MNESTSDECCFAIRSETGDYLVVSLLARTHDAQDYWDGNWIDAHVELRAGGFRGTVKDNLRCEELTGFHKELERLQNELRGKAEFETLEGWLSIQIEGDGLGHMTCHCEIKDEPGIGNTLQFRFVTDQTFTRNTVNDLLLAIQAFPVIGNS